MRVAELISPAAPPLSFRRTRAEYSSKTSLRQILFSDFRGWAETGEAAAAVVNGGDGERTREGRWRKKAAKKRRTRALWHRRKP